MKAEIITIGDELLIGQVIDTNSAWMAEQLNLIGINVHQITSISDQSQHILKTLKEAGNRARIVLITGGLGPTRDDITKEALCQFFDTKLVLNQEALEDVTRFFEKRNIAITELNRKQAELPEECKSIPNPIGTARGMWFEKENTVYVSMPGVPFEMKQMMTNSILPMLKERFSLATVIHKTILTTGLGESFLAARIEQWEDDLPAGVKLAYLPQPGIVRLRLTGKSCHAEKLKNDIAEHTIKLKQLIPDLIFGEDQDTMEKVIGDKLKLRGETISTAESCTGGYIAHLITSLPGSSQWYNGSIVSYSNEAKHNLLEVPTDLLEKFGAVSQEVVESMALRVKEKFNTTWSIAVSGIAGPDGGTVEKPVGTVWVAIAGPNYLQSEHFLFGDNRERNIRRSAIAALNLLRIKLD